MNYGYGKQISLSWAESLERVKEALVEKGFGILTEIDVRATLKKKLDVSYENYVILGVCNPQLAFEALQVEKKIGLLLPCNVIVYEEKGKVFIWTILPTAALEIVGNRVLDSIAKKAQQKLKSAIDNV